MNSKCRKSTGASLGSSCVMKIIGLRFARDSEFIKHIRTCVGYVPDDQVSLLDFGLNFFHQRLRQNTCVASPNLQAVPLLKITLEEKEEKIQFRPERHDKKANPRSRHQYIS